MVYKIAYRRGVEVQKRLDGTEVEHQLPVGEGHIFPTERNGKKNGKLELAFRSLCGKGQYDVVGMNGFIRETAVRGLPLCPECVAKWKADPKGPWARFVKVQE